MLDIYTNNYSIIAQNNLTAASNSLTKSIERLSSGLRINHAADDASGLAISEKLRGQIRGLAKASMNAQDAVSFLQTAEGGMEVIGDMIQRMRELAVQAGNGTYTANDRKELQKEVDALKAEVNRISASTEYNTKKLLTGDAAALWSTDSDSIEAIVRGAPAEGNYRLDISMDPGKNYIYKTDVMKLNETAYEVGFAGLGSSAINSLTYLSGDTDATYTIKANAAQNSAAATFTAYSSTGTVSVTNLKAQFVASVSAGGTHVNNAGYVVVEFLDTVKTTGNSTYSMNARLTFIDAATGAQSSKTQTLVMPVGSNADNLINIGGNEFHLNIQAGSPQTYAAGTKLGIKLNKEIAANDGVLLSGSGSMKYEGVVVTAADTAGKASVYSLAYMSAGASAGFIDVAGFSIDTKVDLPDAASLTLKVNSFDIAKESTKLADIARFTNADGRMILDNTQELILYGNGKQTTLTVEGCDTVGDFRDKLTKAIIDLGMGATAETAGSQAAADEINNNLVNYYSSASFTASGNGAVPGTFIIQSALIGKDSGLHFIGDESLINALSLATIQEGTKSQTTVNVVDAHTGKSIGSDTVCDNVLRGVIKGIDVKIDSTTGSEAEWNAATGQIDFTQSTATKTAYLHVVNNATEVQVGANEGQTFDISVGQMNTTSLEIDDAYVMTMDLSQKAITKFDQALEKVNSSRATIGAQINRLEYTMKNLSISRQNLIAAESRIRDLDVAEESANFTKNQILVNAATAMLAQANTLPQIALQLIGR